jgi:antirestriction protein ArdC
VDANGQILRILSVDAAFLHIMDCCGLLRVLKDDKRAIFAAAAHAQRAVNFLHGLQPSVSEDREAA